MVYNCVCACRYYVCTVSQQTTEVYIRIQINVCIYIHIQFKVLRQAFGGRGLNKGGWIGLTSVFLKRFRSGCIAVAKKTNCRPVF